MIDALILIHLIENFLLNMIISPAKIEIHIEYGIINLHPLKFLSYELDNGVLSVFLNNQIPEILI